MTTGTIIGTGYVSRTDTLRGAVPPSVLPAWVTAMANNTWVRLDGDYTTFQASVPMANNKPLRFATDHWLDRDPLYTAHKTGTAAPSGAASGDETAFVRGQNGAALRRLGSVLLISGSGHAVSAVNGVAMAKLNVAAPRWEEATASSMGVDVVDSQFISGWVGPANVGYYNTDAASGTFNTRRWGYFRDGKPYGGHIPKKMWFDDARDRMVLMGAGNPVTGDGGGASKPIHVWLWSTKNWDTAGIVKPNSNDPGGWSSAYGPYPDNNYFYSPYAMDLTTGQIYSTGAASSLYRWNPDPPYTINTLPGKAGVTDQGSNSYAAWIVIRSTLNNRHQVACVHYSGSGTYKLSLFNILAGTWAEDVTVTGFDAAPAQLSLGWAAYNGLEYSEQYDRLIFMDNGIGDRGAFAGNTYRRPSIYSINFSTGVATKIVNGALGTGIFAPEQTFQANSSCGVNTRFKYVPELDVFAYIGTGNYGDATSQPLCTHDSYGALWAIKLKNLPP